MNAKNMTLCKFYSISEINVRLVLIYTLQSMLWITTNQAECGEIICSHVYDPMCGMVESTVGVHVLMNFHNICYLNKMKCRLRHTLLDIHQVNDYLCNIKSESETFKMNSRRVADFSIVGSYQTCNHTCPTFCTDVYEPVCAKIWKKRKEGVKLKPMVNHCHVDMFSCAFGLNVTILSISSCYPNGGPLLFLRHLANLKSLHLLEEGSMERAKLKVYPKTPYKV